MVDATERETTAPDAGCGHVTRTRKSTDTRGKVQAIEVTVYGWQQIVWMDAATKMPLAGTVGPLQAPAVRSMRAVVPQARTNRAGHARLHTGVVAKGCWDGTALWWLDPHARLFVGPAKAHLAVTVDAQAQAAAGEGVTGGRRAPTVRPGHGTTAATERLEPAVVGMAGLTTDAQDGTPEPGRHSNRRAFQPNPSNAVVVRQGRNRD
jgi:hypothetical protein